MAKSKMNSKSEARFNDLILDLDNLEKRAYQLGLMATASQLNQAGCTAIMEHTKHTIRRQQMQAGKGGES